jgi:hypothetical protein
VRFDFVCFALCTVESETDPESDLDEITATLLSFHATVLDAMKEQTHRTELLRAAHKLSYSGPKWPWRAPEFKEPIYQLVPIQSMRFDDLSDAQEMIESAAVLQQKGVGVCG